MEIINKYSLIVPIYINEKIVIDMLAIIDDGFSKVSQVNYSENFDSGSKNALGIGVSTSSIINKFLKIDFKGDITNNDSRHSCNSTSKEKVHTSVSLLSKFRSHLIENKMLNNDLNVKNLKIGDFVEIEGELKKNPLIEFLDSFVNMFKMANIFSEKNKVKNGKNANGKKNENQDIINQITLFSDELKHTGTIDFILQNNQVETVLSTQEQYLSNDNISEIIGGTFKVLGKVIAICEDDSRFINLFRKTTLSLLPEEMLESLFSGFKSDELKFYNLPEFRTKIKGPAIIVIPIAIYS